MPDESDDGARARQLDALLKGYEIAGAESRLTTSLLVQRANVVMLINGGLLALVSTGSTSTCVPALVTFAGIGMALNLFWVLINQRNRAYGRFWHDHMIALEQQINRLCGFKVKDRAGLHTYSDQPDFARGRAVPIVPDKERTRVFRSGCLSIELGFTIVGVLLFWGWASVIPLAVFGVFKAL